jgi:hypothetical protein
MCGVQMVIKCADIGHLAADHNTHKRWSYKLEEARCSRRNSLALPGTFFMKKQHLLCGAKC